MPVGAAWRALTAALTSFTKYFFEVDILKESISPHPKSSRLFLHVKLPIDYFLH
jgi:hypothetical protein